MKIKCRNKFCGYYDKDDYCVCEEASLDDLGICDGMILLEFDDELLNSKREEYRARYAESDLI